jgi:competence protein ComEA
MPISKRNRRGLLLLLFIAAVISYTPRIIAASTSNDDIQITFEELEVVEDEIEVKREFKKSKKKKVWASKYKAPPAAFDPNKYSEKDWMSLGLSKKQSDVVLKFSKRGLRSNDDLEKIFVIPSELFNLIKDSTYYPQIEYKQKFEKEIKKEFVPVDLNTANTEELKSIPGIGDFYARKILEYRSQLGGFVEANQLMEIWKFDSEKFDEIKDKIVLSDSDINRIDINRATIDELKTHPYISYKVANSIVKMRLVNGDYNSIEDILQSKLINRELYHKIKNYLKV